MTTIKLSTVNIEERKAMTFKAGDVVKVDTKVKEGANKDGTPKFRTQAYEGLVLARKHGAEPGATFTVRKMSGTIAVERIFPLYSPAIENITLIRANKTRRSKLYFVRTKAAKETRKKLTEIKKKTIKGVLDAKIETKKATKQAVAA
jgi:large subunit ribosomal protein L19